MADMPTRGGWKIMTTQSANQLTAAGAAPEERYEGVGHSLKVVRERRGLALTDVSSRLRIRRPYLEAIEEGRFSELPGAVYISGFLRQYAEFLGLDPEQVLKTYQAEASDAPHRPVLNFPMPRPEERTPRLWLVMGALVLAGIVYTLWYRHQEALRFGHELIQAVPAHLADLIPASQPIAPATLPQPAPAAPLTAPAVAPSPEPPVAAVPQASVAPPPAAATDAPSLPAASAVVAPSPAPAAPPAESSEQPQTETASATDAAPAPEAEATASTETAAVSDPPATEAAASATDPASSAPASYGVSESEARIRVEATAPSWIQVRGPNNEQIFTRLLNTGERYLVPNREGLTLLTGNAGGVRIVVDGQALPALGASGEVKRGIVLDPERLKTAMTEQQG